MKITLDNIELNQAVIEYLNNQGLTLNTNKVHIEITSEGVKIDTNKPNRQEAKDSVQEPVKPNKPNNKPKDSDIYQLNKKSLLKRYLTHQMTQQMTS